MLESAVYCFLLVLSCQTVCSPMRVDCEGNCTVSPDGDCSHVERLASRECANDFSLPLDCAHCFRNQRVLRNFCDDDKDSCPQDVQWNAELHYTFRYRDQDTLYLELEWNPDQSLGPYTLIIAYSTNHAEICRRSNKVATRLDQSRSQFRTDVVYHRGTTLQYMSVLLIPDGLCRGPNITIENAQNCYSLCPGMCSCCKASTSRPSIRSVSNVCMNDTTSAVSISWEPGELYHAPHPGRTFILELGPARVAVVGKTDVVLYVHGETAAQPYTIKIKECQCAKESSTLTAEIPQCSSPYITPTSISSVVNTLAASTLVASNLAAGTLAASNLAAGTLAASNLAAGTLTTSLAAGTLTASNLASSALVASNFASGNLAAAASSSAANTAAASPLPGSISVTSSTLLATGPTNTSPTATPLLLYITSVIAALALVILLMVILLVIIKRRRRLQTDGDYIDPHPEELKVLVLFSPASSQYDCKCIMENIVKELAKYGIHSVFFQNSSQRGSITEWIDTNVKSCCKIFMVCNKQFAQEWVQPTGNYLRGNSVVYVLRQVVDSYVVKDKRKLEKFAILYLRKKDQDCLDYPYTRNIKGFLVNPRNASHLEQIVRFIHDQPTYTLENCALASP